MSTQRNLLVLAALLLIAPASIARTVRVPTQTASGAKAVEALTKYGMVDKAIEQGYSLLWDDIDLPDVWLALAAALEKKKRSADAATVYALLGRIAGKMPKAAATKYKRKAQSRLRFLDRKHRMEKKKHERGAKGRKFTSADKVSDLWMTQVKADLHTLHNLMLWKIVGGRRDAKPDWIHNVQGALHRSGANLMDDVHGRKGVLFTIAIKNKGDSSADKFHRDIATRLGHPTRITIANPGKTGSFRLGVRASSFPCVIHVLVGGKKAFSAQVKTSEWSDLKFDVSRHAGYEKEVTVEVVCPKGQKYSGGILIDYMDFFPKD